MEWRCAPLWPPVGLRLQLTLTLVFNGEHPPPVGGSRHDQAFFQGRPHTNRGVGLNEEGENACLYRQPFWKKKKKSLSLFVVDFTSNVRRVNILMAAWMVWNPSSAFHKQQAVWLGGPGKFAVSALVLCEAFHPPPQHMPGGFAHCPGSNRRRAARREQTQASTSWEPAIAANIKWAGCQYDTLRCAVEICYDRWGATGDRECDFLSYGGPEARRVSSAVREGSWGMLTGQLLLCS